MKKLLTITALFAFALTASAQRLKTPTAASSQAVTDSLIKEFRIFKAAVELANRQKDTADKRHSDSLLWIANRTANWSGDLRKVSDLQNSTTDNIQKLTTQLQVTTDTSIAAYKLAADMKATYSAVAIDLVNGLFGLNGNIPVANQPLYDLINKALDDKIKLLKVTATIQ